MAQTTPLLERVLEVLRDHREDARATGVELIGVVGSVARGEQHEGSDVDVVYDVLTPGHLWPFLGVVADIEDELGRKVDIVDRQMMRAEHWAWMSRDLARL